MRVAVDESRDDRRARGVDGLGTLRIRRPGVGPEVGDAVALDEERDAGPEGRRAAVREGRAAEQRGPGYLAFLPIVRMNVSIGIALCTLPRAPSPTETRATVSMSLASTIFTKS